MFWTVCFSLSSAVNMENDRPEDFEPPVKRLALEHLEESSGSETEIGESSDSEVDMEEAPVPEVNAGEYRHAFPFVPEDQYMYSPLTEYRSEWANEMLDDWGMNRRRLIVEEEDFPDEGVSIKFLVLLYLYCEIKFNLFVYLFQFEPAGNEPRILEGRELWPLDLIPQDPEDYIAPDFRMLMELHYPPFLPDPDFFIVALRRIKPYGWYISD